MLSYFIVAGSLLATLGADMPARDGGSWTAWHGCWRAADNAGVPGQIVCMLPGATAAEVRMVTIADDAVQGTVVVRADGVPRVVSEGGCTGTEVAQWSRDGRRVFMRAELECDGLHRVSTGVLAMTGEEEWVDVQAATVSGQHATRSIRYVAVPAALAPAEVRAEVDDTRTLLREAARLRAAAPLHVEDIVEAAGMLAEPALQGFLATNRLAFRLDARTLIRLEEAGVPGSGIDLVVALAHPQHFAVREADRDAPVPQRVARTDERLLRCYDPVRGLYLYGDDCYTTRYYRDMNWYGLRFGYWGYSPWGYDPYGWRYGGVPVVIVTPGGESRSPGELVKGSGYSRGSAPGRGTAQPRSGGTGGAEPRSSGASSSGASNSGRTAVPRGDSGSSGASSSGASSSGSSSSGSSSSGSSSSSNEGGRTAVPRP